MHVCTVFALCVQSCIVTPFGILEGLFGSLPVGGKMDRCCSFKMASELESYGGLAQQNLQCRR
jgi:hypothetical protein